jgi:hypothetical protein
MKMKRKLSFIITAMGVSLLLSPLNTRAQSADVPKYEVGVDFTSLSLEYGTTLPGLGGRFTYNLNKHVALEAAGYFFPGKCETCNGEITGHVTEGLFGVKVGKRFQKWGVFGKARPGFMSFGKGYFDIVPTGGSGPFPFVLQIRRNTPLALDVGAVIEFYPSNELWCDSMVAIPSSTIRDIRYIPSMPTQSRAPSCRIRLRHRGTHGTTFNSRPGLAFGFRAQRMKLPPHSFATGVDRGVILMRVSPSSQ